MFIIRRDVRFIDSCGYFQMVLVHQELVLVQADFCLSKLEINSKMYGCF